MINKKVSIAMATYNGERFLRQQLESLLNQTIKPYEILIVDDCSSDGTIDILKEYQERDLVKLQINESNLGVNKTFEKSMRLCSGEYIMFCDQDDVWFPNKVEVTLKKMIEIEENLPAVVSSQCNDIDAAGNVIRLKIPQQDTSSIEATIIGQGKSQGCTLMLNRKLISILKPFPEKVPLYDVYVSLLAAALGIKYNLGIPLMNYRHHNTNVIAKINNKKQNIFNRILIKIRENKFIIPKQRFDSLRLIRREYGNSMKPQVLKLIDGLIEYEKTNVLRQLKFIFSLRGLSYPYKIKNSIYQIMGIFC